MASSVIVAAKRSLVTLLQARPLLDGVQVSYGWPGDDAAERERIFTSRARATHEPASLKTGRTFRNETADFDVVIHVEAIDASPEDADDRALELGRQLEECVADNRTLAGVAGLNWCVVASWQLTGLYNDKGSLSELTYVIRYNARLT